MKVLKTSGESETQQTQGGNPSITGATINTGVLSGSNNCANCGYLSNGLGMNVRGDLGYFNGIEIQFSISGDLKGYKVSVSRTKTFVEARNGVPFNSGNNRNDGPDIGNVFLANGMLYSIDMPGFSYGKYYCWYIDSRHDWVLYRNGNYSRCKWEDCKQLFRALAKHN